MTSHPQRPRPPAKFVLRSALAFALALSAKAAEQKSGPSENPAGTPAENPELLSFDELTTLASTAVPEGVLAARLNALLNTPFLHRETATPDPQPRRPNVEGLGPVLRVGVWNIERGLNFELIRSALGGSSEFLRLAGMRAGSRKKEVESQLAMLQGVDVLILNEADWGMKRTEYRDVTREFAAALHTNYAFGVEFVEVDPVFDLGTQSVHLPDAQEDRRLQQDLQVDRERYPGLHGTAVLSRYPIE